jgi:hypothetical protein
MVKHFFYIPLILVVWWRTTSQTGEFAIDGRSQYADITIHVPVRVHPRGAAKMFSLGAAKT